MPKVDRTSYSVAKNSQSIFLGIDPGAAGGLAYVFSDRETPQYGKMPETEQDIWNWVKGFKTQGLMDYELFAAIEKVQGYIGDKQPGSAMFKFGASYGSLKMALTAGEIPFEEVTPQTWQKGLSISPRKKDESKSTWKNRLRSKAQQIFPGRKITLAVSDALLLAEYCRRKRTGTL